VFMVKLVKKSRVASFENTTKELDTIIVPINMIIVSHGLFTNLVLDNDLTSTLLFLPHENF
jgi:hypothetical protein